MTNAEVAREIAYQLKKYPTDVDVQSVQRVLDRAYPATPEVAELIAAGRKAQQSCGTIGVKAIADLIAALEQAEAARATLVTGLNAAAHLMTRPDFCIMTDRDIEAEADYAAARALIQQLSNTPPEPKE